MIKIFIQNRLIGLFIMLISTTNYSFAQELILKGRVKLSKGETASYSVVTVSSKEYKNTLYQALCDSLGAFSITIGDIDLNDAVVNSSYIGYKAKSVSVPLDMSPIEIVLEPSPLVIENVVITGSKPLITYNRTEMNIDVKQIKNYEKLNTTEVLSRLPGVIGSGSSWELNGQGVTIYVNGQKQTIPAEALTSFLESLPAKALKSIKLNTLSYGKYSDSSGAVMDIVLDKDMADSEFLSASVQGAAVKDGYTSAGANLFYMVKKKKTMFNTTLSFNNSDIWSQRKDSLYWGEKDSYYKTYIEQDGIKNSINSSSNMTIYLKNESCLDVNLFAYYDWIDADREWLDVLSSIDNVATDSNSNILNSESNNDMYSTTVRFSTSDKRRTYLDVTYNGMYGSRSTDGDYYYKLGFEKFQVSNYLMQGHMHDLNLKFVTKFTDKFIVDYGANISYNRAKTKNNYYYADYSPFELQELDADEALSNVYINARYDLNKRMGLMARIRHQYTYQNMHDLSDDDATVLKYDNLTPSITYWFNSSNYKLSIDMMTYLKRPNYSDMFAGRSYITDYYYSVGNTMLLAEKHSFVSFDQTFWGEINLYLQYKSVKDKMYNVYNQDSDDNIYNKFVNVSDWDYLYANLSLPVVLFGNSVYGNINGRIRYGRFYNYSNEYSSIKDESWNMQDCAISYKLHIDASDKLTFNTSGSYSFGYEVYQSIYTPTYSFGLGASYSFAKDRFVAKANVYSICNNDNMRDISFYNNSLVSTSYNRGPFLSLSLRYQLSRGKKIEKREFRGENNRF